ncbi:uncharacterized protein LOC143859450 [Tasmannia lanceolata]|uniref:uncharacterized protein LOC143859450 n=1 Tax=Tasmannia lanceolata TaxID=3420 RepID=UPI0040642361
MADGTRARQNSQSEAAPDKLNAQLAILQRQMREDFMTLLAPMQQKLDKLSSDFESSKNQPPQFTSNSFSNQEELHFAALSIPFSKHLKLDFPRFSGGDPTAWLFKVAQFFSFHQTPENQKLLMVSFHMEGSAASWFQWMSNSNQLRSWQEFESALKFRFGSSPYDNPQGKIELSTTVYGLSDQFLKSCFISGLKPEIKLEVIAHQPFGLLQAIGLARLQEDKIAEARISGKQLNSKFVSQTSLLGPQPSFPNPKYLQSSSNQFSNPILPSSKIPTSYTNPIPAKFPIKKLSFAEMQQRREKGLCFNCDERFHTGHKCKNQMSLLLLEGDNEEDAEFPSAELELPSQSLESVIEPTITFYALIGLNVSRTLRLEGVIENHVLQVLVDGGSTHNFIQERVAKFLGLPITHSPHFKVQVGNGQFLTCQGMCSKIQIVIQNHSFVTDFFIISLQGADVILGVQWLQGLGPITTDYNSLTMDFMWKGQPVHFQGIQENRSNFISTNQLHKLADNGGLSSCFMLFSSTATSSTDQQANLPFQQVIPALQPILHQFKEVFAEPSSLPPSRSTDHRILLEPNSKPVNIKPYRYPHFQKSEIEKLIKEMLDSGIIQPSTSPFSSPVLLVKKKMAVGDLASIIEKGVQPDPKKIETMLTWPIPKTLKQLRGFLGLTDYYRKFVKGYASIAAPSTELLKGNGFSWTELAELAFENLSTR